MVCDYELGHNFGTWEVGIDNQARVLGFMDRSCFENEIKKPYWFVFMNKDIILRLDKLCISQDGMLGFVDRSVLKLKWKSFKG